MPTGRAPRVAIIAIGNPLMSDDGVAEAVLVELDRTDPRADVRLINAGADPLRVAQELSDLDAALVVDAADMGLEPGTIRTFDADQVGVSVNVDSHSVHDIDLNTVVRLVRELGLSDKLRFVGVQPASLEPGDGLSPELRARLPHIVRQVSDEIARLLSSNPKEETEE